jgi:hypothetical protein
MCLCWRLVSDLFYVAIFLIIWRPKFDTICLQRVKSMRPKFPHVSAPHYFCIYSNKHLRTVLNPIWLRQKKFGSHTIYGDLFTEFYFNFFLGFAPGPLGNCEDVNECVEYGHQCAFRCHNIPGIYCKYWKYLLKVYCSL